MGATMPLTDLSSDIKSAFVDFQFDMRTSIFSSFHTSFSVFLGGEK